MANWTYAYDATDQLTNALAHPVDPVDSVGEYAYTYDPMGNVTRRVTPSNDGGSSVTSTYDPNNLNQLVMRSSQSEAGYTTNALSYDLTGNLTNACPAIGGDGTRVYTWTLDNRITNVEPLNPEPGDRKVASAYDYMGRRVKKVTSEYSGSTWSVSATNLYFYDGWNLVRSTTMSNDVVISTNHYTWSLDLSGSFQGAGGIGGLLSATFGGSNTVYYCYDHNGNVTRLINETGATVAQYEYDPFGRIIRSTGDAAEDNPFRFSTKYTDDESGLVYYGYRFYDPELGRWPSRDPLEEGFKTFTRFNPHAWRVETIYDFSESEPNLYAFVENDPVKEIDPDGRAKFKYHGNWCGPGWTSGKWISAGDFDWGDGDLAIPVDDLDTACMVHDACLAGWDVIAWKPADPKSSGEQCDEQLCDAAGDARASWLKKLGIRCTFCILKPNK